MLRSLLGVVPLVALLSGACSGEIGGEDPAAPGASSGTESIGDSPLRRLTRLEYERTVTDLLGVSVPSASAFPSELSEDGFSNDAASLVVSPLLAEKYLRAAEEISAAVDLSTILPCDPSGEELCARELIETLGLRAYRRPLQTSEIDALLGLFSTVRAQDDFDQSVRSVIQALLISPHFLYRVELADPGDKSGAAVALTSWEMASRLSYFFWGTMPDTELFAAAAANELTTSVQIADQARRLLASSRARGAIVAFFVEWLGIHRLDEVDKDSELFPELDAELKAALMTETQSFIEHVLWEDDGRLETLMTKPASVLDARLIAHYGVSEPASSGFSLVALDPAQRGGLLTQGSVLTVHAANNQTDPVQRGKLVRERFLCQTLEPPPPDVMPVVPDLDPNLSTRERFQQHQTDPACSGCHQLMDPIGFGFERYDAIGRYRTLEGDLPIDDSGTIVQSQDIDGDFAGVVELSEKLVSSDEFRRCVTRQWFRYAFGRSETEADAGSVAAMAETFAASDHDIRELLIAVTQTDAFRYRKPSEVTP